MNIQCLKLLYFQFQLGIPICLFWSANFIFGNPKEANWNTKSEIGNIEVLDISEEIPNLCSDLKLQHPRHEIKNGGAIAPIDPCCRGRC